MLVANTPTRVSIPTISLKTVKDFSLDIPNLRYFYDKPGASNVWFSVQSSTSIEISINNKIVILELYKNGVRVDGISAKAFIAVSGQIVNMSLSGVVQCTQGDYLEMYITLSGAGTATYDRLAINITEMVGAV
jgi:hypothetical protein